MKRLALGLGLVAAVLVASVGSAQVDRYVVEFTDGGVTVNSVSAPVLVKDNGTTVLKSLPCASNLCARAVPSGATEGLALARVRSYVITAKLSSGTFLGTGALEVWRYNPGTLAAWSIVQGASITPESGQTIFHVGRDVDWRPGLSRLAVRPVGVGTSAASPNLTIEIAACTSTGCGQ
jgi:hypothetical protein